MNYKERAFIESEIKSYLNSQDEIRFHSYNTEPRVVGDFVERLIKNNFSGLFSKVIKKYKSDFTRKSMEDISFYDLQNNYYAVDIKTHRTNDSTFNMPNLISMRVLDDFYRESDNNYFMILRIDYQVKGTKILIDQVSFNPIESYDWKCLRIGALGWGQIQISDASEICMNDIGKAAWMEKMCTIAMEHYNKEINKIKESRLPHFSNSLDYWKRNGAKGTQ